MDFEHSKKTWLRYSTLSQSRQEVWLRDKIASLYDIKDPTERQKKLLRMAWDRLVLMDLPSEVFKPHEKEFRALAEAEFGRLPAA
jgi:hypothetical protein